MKKYILLIACVWMLLGKSIAQDDPPFDIGVKWGIQILKKDGLFGFPGKAVHGSIMYKDKDSLVVYTEDHSGVLDDASFLGFNIGNGTNPSPPVLTPEIFKRITSVCWNMIVETQVGPAVFTGTQKVSSVPRSNVAAHALNSERLGGALFNDELLGLDEFVDPPPPTKYGLTSWNTDYPEIRPVNTWDFVRTDPASSIVTGNPLKAVRIGKGTSWPFVFGPSTPAQLENLYTVCAPPLVNFRHALGIKVAEHRGLVNHNTAAIYADNTGSEMSAGVLAAAQTWGIYGTAQNGVVGITNGLLNGAAITGFVGAAPETGGFKYGLYGNANSILNAWAAALFGNSFHTGTLTMSSDARLKTQIRGQLNVLDKVMQLKPSQYEYRQDTPYSLPTGLHHGFLAQDVELIFPELIADIEMPLNLDPQKMYKSGTTSYKGINYIEMIAILTSAVQEMNTSLNAKIDAQAKEIEALRKALAEKN